MGQGLVLELRDDSHRKVQEGLVGMRKRALHPVEATVGRAGALVSFIDAARREERVVGGRLAGSSLVGQLVGGLEGVERVRGRRVRVRLVDHDVNRLEHLLQGSRIRAKVRGAGALSWRAVRERAPLGGEGWVEGGATPVGHKMLLVPFEHLELVPAIRAAIVCTRVCRICHESNDRQRRPFLHGRYLLHDRLEARLDVLEDAVGLRLLVEEGRGELEPLGAVEQAFVKAGIEGDVDAQARCLSSSDGFVGEVHLGAALLHFCRPVDDCRPADNWGGGDDAARHKLLAASRRHVRVVKEDRAGHQVQLLKEGVGGRQAARPLLHGHVEDGGADGVRGEVGEIAPRAAVAQDVGQTGGHVPNDLVGLVVGD
mmetsp:Transcript_35529/g.83845  ORF Transcript_35529/g.83845 Transcript_35529/m.83845 type:complete len:370 (+) Transcript_35529:393-1502(+)